MRNIHSGSLRYGVKKNHLFFYFEHKAHSSYGKSRVELPFYIPMMRLKNGPYKINYLKQLANAGGRVLVTLPCPYLKGWKTSCFILLKDGTT